MLSPNSKKCVKWLIICENMTDKKKPWKKGEKIHYREFEPTVETDKLRAWSFSKEDAKAIERPNGGGTLTIDIEKEIIHESRVYSTKQPSEFTARILAKRNLETGKITAFIKTPRYYTKPREMSRKEYDDFVRRFERASEPILDIKHAVVCTQKDYEECNQELKKRMKK